MLNNVTRYRAGLERSFAAALRELKQARDKRASLRPQPQPPKPVEIPKPAPKPAVFPVHSVPDSAPDTAYMAAPCVPATASQ